MDEASLLLRSTLEKLLESFQVTSMKEKEKNSQIQELNSKREEERKESQNLALKYNKVVTQHNAQLNRAKTLQSKRDNLVNVFPYIIFFALGISYFLSGLAYLESASVGRQGEQE